jgi:hypothetical protein
LCFAVYSTFVQGSCCVKFVFKFNLNLSDVPLHLVFVFNAF